MNTSINIFAFNAYVTALASHDWQYEFSDDHREYRKGSEANKQLMATANKHPLFMQAYNAYDLCKQCTTGSLLACIEKREKTIEALRKQVRELNAVAA